MHQYHEAQCGQRWRCDTTDENGELFIWIGEITMLLRRPITLRWTKGNMKIIQIIQGKLPDSRKLIAHCQYIFYPSCVFNNETIPEKNVCFFEDLEELNNKHEHIFTYLPGQDKPQC
jgi:hypothetical protein